MHKNIILKIYGRVQGVGFRYSTMMKARELGIKGFVKNNYDGSVYIEAEGEEKPLNYLIDWCKKGPGLAKIDDVFINEGELMNYKNFKLNRQNGC